MLKGAVYMGTAIVLGLIVLIANLDYFIGKTNISRPLIIGLMVGIVMGDISTGLIMGATLELAFIGAFAIGAAIPPDLIVGSTLAVAFAISAGRGAEDALLLALPISSVALFVRMFCLGVVNPLLLHRADHYAQQGDVDGVARMHILGGVLIGVLTGIVAAVAYAAGSSVVEGFLNAIPAFVQSGMYIATGILPAIGLAMLAKLLWSKELAVFFFLGFAMAIYLEVPMTGMAIFGIILALIMVAIKKMSSGAAAVTAGGAEDDDF